LKSKFSGVRKDEPRAVSGSKRIVSLGFENKDDIALSSLKSKSSTAKKMGRSDVRYSDGNESEEDFPSISPRNEKKNKINPLKTLKGVTLKRVNKDIPLSSLRDKNKRKTSVEKTNVSFDKSLSVKGKTETQHPSNSIKKRKKEDMEEDTDSDDDMLLIRFKKKELNVYHGEIEQNQNAPESKQNSSNISDTSCADKDEGFNSSCQNNNFNLDHKTGKGKPIRPQFMETQDSTVSDHLKADSASTLSRNQNEIVDHMKSGKNHKRLRIGTDDSDEENGSRKIAGTIDYSESETPLSYQNMAASTSIYEPASSALEDTPQAATESGSNVLENTPGSAKIGLEVGKRNLSNFLTDTPTTIHGDMTEEIICQICTSSDSKDENPLVLCDGCNLGFHKLCYPVEVDIESAAPWYCDTCDHRPATSLYSTSATDIICTYCCQRGGALRKEGGTWYHPLCLAFSSKMTSASCCTCSLFGAVQCNLCSNAVHPYCALDAGWTIVRTTATKALPMNYSIFCPKHSGSVGRTSSEKTQIIRSEKKLNTNTSLKLKNLKRKGTNASEQERKMSERCSDTNGVGGQNIETLGDTDGDDEMMKKEKERLKERRRQGLARFVLQEVEIDSDQENDNDENEELRRLEEEEVACSQDSFINDNPDLTQHLSQDLLGDIDPDAASTAFDYGAGKNHNDQGNDDSQHIHRALDARRERENQFNTPNFNRRMTRQPNSSPSSSTENGSSIAPSERGLGRMNFIRSVLEHHRQGGDCDQIEAEYMRLDATAAVQNNTVDITLPAPASESTPSNNCNTLIDLSTPESKETNSPIQQTVHSQGTTNNHGEAKPNNSTGLRVCVSNNTSTHATSNSMRNNTIAITNTNDSLPHQSRSSSCDVGVGLTAEQLARIEANRQAALRRRAQFQAKNGS